MSFIQNTIYPRMPVLIQNFMISGFGYYWKKRRYGSVFDSFLKEVISREFYTEEQWYDYQTFKLRTLLKQAYVNVPFYNQKYKDAGFSKKDFEIFKLEDLNKLPFLEKEELRQFGTTSLLSKNLSKGIYISSSGSSGTPTRIFLPEYFHQQWSAIGEARMRNWAGVDYKTPRGMIGGRRILPDSKFKKPFYRYNIIEKQTYFSAYHIAPETAENYVEGMVKHGVEYMTGYAMSNFLLAKFIEDQDILAPKMKAVITSSEKLTAEMRNTLERVYQCKVFDAYSGCEACGLISESPEGKLLFSPDSGIMELIKDDETYAKPGDIGEIVSTGLCNYDQPLIRYRIGDVAKLSEDQSPVGGRFMPVIDEILGRVEDVIYGKDGRAMVRFHGIYIDIPGLKAAQIIQHDYDKFSFKLLIDKVVYNKIIAEKIIAERLISQLGKISIQYDYPDQIKAGANGKIKAVISKLRK